MKNWCAERIRLAIFHALKRLDRWDALVERMMLTEVGVFSGHVSDLDKAEAERRQLKSLNRFEKWLMQPLIDFEKSRRGDAFRRACIEVLGEDPETDWVY